MSTCEQGIYAFEKSFETIEKLAQRGTFSISDQSFLALQKTYEELIELSAVSDESMIDAFLVSQV
ncbi:MAG: hypothetical protein D3909_19515 [Candidatus Electrothrix sp. ATG1]|nr:hypothetical protein [Candidatus Electrothrix sp. ATG1]